MAQRPLSTCAWTTCRPALPERRPAGPPWPARQALRARSAPPRSPSTARPWRPTPTGPPRSPARRPARRPPRWRTPSGPAGGRAWRSRRRGDGRRQPGRGAGARRRHRAGRGCSSAGARHGTRGLRPPGWTPGKERGEGAERETLGGLGACHHGDSHPPVLGEFDADRGQGGLAHAGRPRDHRAVLPRDGVPRPSDLARARPEANDHPRGGAASLGCRPCQRPSNSFPLDFSGNPMLFLTTPNFEGNTGDAA